MTKEQWVLYLYGITKQLTLWIDEDSIIITEKDIMVLNAEHFI